MGLFEDVIRVIRSIDCENLAVYIFMTASARFTQCFVHIKGEM